MSFVRMVREGSIAVFTLVALVTAPLAHAAPPTASSSASLKDAAIKALPMAGPGILVGVVGGVMLANAVAAAATAGTALTVAAVALPVLLLATGIGLTAWGSWRAYKALTANGSPVTLPPAPPGSSPGRTTDPGTGVTPNNETVPPPPGNNGGGNSGPRPIPGRTRPSAGTIGTGISDGGTTGSNVRRNTDTRVAGDPGVIGYRAPSGIDRETPR